MNIINLLQNNWVVLAITSGFLGLVIGSFLNVVIYRLPIMINNECLQEYADFFQIKVPPQTSNFNLLLPRSHCPKCKKIVPWYRNIPLLSFILQKGKCAECGIRISWHYPLVELLTCLATIFVSLHLGIAIQTVLILILTWGLIAATFIDLDHQLLPDSIVLSLIWLGLLANAFHTFTSPQNAIFGTIIAYLSLWSVAALFKLVRKIDGMGNGDFKLFAVFGAWFGWKLLPIIILLAAIAGTIVGLIWVIYKNYNLQKKIPFGPFIATAGWVSIFWGEKILTWYSSLFRFVH